MIPNKYKKHVYFLRGDNKDDDREKKWDERFFLDKIPPYDAYKDVNYLSLGLIKSKIKYENYIEKEKSKNFKIKNPFYSEHYLIESQPKKDVLNKRLIFSINSLQEKNKIDDTKNSHSLTYSHHIDRKKSTKKINKDKKIDYKYKTNYLPNFLSPNTLNQNNRKTKLTMEESDLLEEFELVKIMWNKFGVTKKYK